MGYYVFLSDESNCYALFVNIACHNIQVDVSILLLVSIAKGDLVFLGVTQTGESILAQENFTILRSIFYEHGQDCC